jgi:hypothetical protein
VQFQQGVLVVPALSLRELGLDAILPHLVGDLGLRHVLPLGALPGQAEGGGDLLLGLLRPTGETSLENGLAGPWRLLLLVEVGALRLRVVGQGGALGVGLGKSSRCLRPGCLFNEQRMKVDAISVGVGVIVVAFRDRPGRRRLPPLGPDMVLRRCRVEGGCQSKVTR